MRNVAVALVLAGSALAQESVLLGIRDNPKQDPDAAPARTTIAIDVLTLDRTVDTRRVVIKDSVMRRRLFSDPFVIAARPDLAYLVCTEGNGVRCLRFSWARGEDFGKSFLIRCDTGSFLSRPLPIVPERIGFLSRGSLVSLDLRLGTHVRTRVGARPLDLDVNLNRLYVSAQRGRLDFVPLLVTNPPPVAGDARPLWPLPDRAMPLRAAVRPDGMQAAYVSRHPTDRDDAERFVLSVADNARRLLVRRSLPGRFRDLRWLDDRRILITATHRETMVVHELRVAEDRLRSRRLPARYLAPPEIASAKWLGLSLSG